MRRAGFRLLGRPNWTEVRSDFPAQLPFEPLREDLGELRAQRLVLSFVGDGGFMMTGQELATAVQHGARPIVIVLDNGMYGTIRMHQERAYPGRISGTDLVNPDFAALGRALGAPGELVTRSDEFASALERAVGSGRAALLALRTDPELVSTRQTLGAVCPKALEHARRT